MDTVTPTYAIVRTPRQGAPFTLLLAGPLDRVMARWAKLDLRQGTAWLVFSAGPAVLGEQSGPNLRTRW